MQPQLSSRALMKALKHLLKKRNLTYQEVGEHLGLSLPAVKRAMNQEDMSVDRILKICELIGVELRDLLDIATDERTISHRFSPEQELFFSQNPHYLAYFFEIHQNRLQPIDIEKKHKINPRSSLKYLAKLEKFGLVRMDKNSFVRSTVAPVISWDDHGPIGRVFSSSLLQGLSERVLKQIKSGAPAKLFLNGWHLRKEEFIEFFQEFQELQNKFRQLSVFNRRHNRASPLDFVSVALLADAWDAKLFQTVKEI